MTVSDWLFGPDDCTIRVRNAEALLPQLPFFIAWPFRWAGPAGTSPTLIEVVERADGGFEVVSAGLVAGPFEDAIDAAEALSDALIAAYFVATATAEQSRHDVAALATPRGLALLACEHDTVTLALALAARGYRLFATDRIALRTSSQGAPTGICLGRMPILSGALPEGAEPALVEFVEGYTEMRRGDVAFLKLWTAEAASFGEAAPVAAWIGTAWRPGAADAVEPGAAPIAGVPGYRVTCDGFPAALRLVSAILAGL